MKNLSISIVLYNNDIEDIKMVLNGCFETVANKDVYIIDHSDKASFLDYLNNRKVNYLKSKNTGFGSGHNKAMYHFKLYNKYKYHLILNPDINFKKNTIFKLLNYLYQNKDVGAIMPKILNFDGTLQFSRRCLPKPKYLIMKRLFPNSLSALEYELKFYEPKEELELIGISGCFMIVNTKIIKKIGFFDERYFMYFEDFDLARRISEISKVVYYPKASVFHKGNSEHKRNIKLFYHLLRSAFLYFKKWGIIDKYRESKNAELINKFNIK